MAQVCKINVDEQQTQSDRITQSHYIMAADKALK